MNEGFESMRLGLRGMPAAAEEVMIYREIALAELTGAKVHILHISSKGGVELIRQGKSRESKPAAKLARIISPLQINACEHSIATTRCLRHCAPKLILMQF